jgi:flagellar hook-associated protein 1 FlgK
MSLTSLLSIARTALLTQQRAIDVTGHNIANAQTPGYTRQRLALQAETPLNTGHGQVGRGVTAAGIERLRDGFLDETYRRENGDLGKFGTLKDMLGQVDALFSEPTDVGIANGIDELFSAFADLANDPSGQTARGLVRQSAQNLTARFQEADGRLSSMSGEVRARMEDAVSTITSLTQQIADLNTRIRGAGAGLRESPDLKDKRDTLVDQLSGLIGVRVLDREDGTIGLIAGDALLVDGAQVSNLEIRDLENGQIQVGAEGTATSINLSSGSLSGLVELATRTIPGMRDQLDTLVAGIVREFNALHAAGRTNAGATGINFFATDGVTANTFRLSDDIQASLNNIAAGISGAPGDNATALAIAGLRTRGVGSFNGDSIGGAFQKLVSSLGVSVADAGSKQEAQATLVLNADATRQSVAGVSIDEELTALISQQTAYSAAARLVTVADEMIQDVLNMVGR